MGEGLKRAFAAAKQTRIAADYSTRKNYQSNYAKENREAINARKREWRKARKKDAVR